MILHASESSRQMFVDGFYLYFIRQEKKERIKAFARKDEKKP